MDILAKAYDDESSTPKPDQNREDSSEGSPQPQENQRRMDSLQSKHALDNALKWSGDLPASAVAARDTDSDSSDSNDDSDSAEDQKTVRTAARRSSLSSEISSVSSSGSGSVRSDGSKKSTKEKEAASTGKDRRTSTSKVSSRRSRSRSCSKGRRRRRSSDRRRRSRSRDRHHKSSRSERRSGRRSRSRSRSRDRHHSSRHHRDHRRREGHRRRRSSSRDGHRHRRRSSPGHRHRHHSRSPEHRKGHHSEKKKRSRSPQPATVSRTEDSSITVTTSTNTTSSRPPVFKVAGVKFSRGRGSTTGTFKDMMREEFKQQIQQVQDIAAGRGQSTSTTPPQITSSVATVSAGTGVMGSGGLNQVLLNQMQLHLQQQQQPHYLPGQPGCLTAEQKELNQRFILQSTGRTREQVEAQYGVKIPSMYNEATNNFVELAQRDKKRQLLWKNNDKKKAEGNSTFNAVPILPGQTKSENLKFARLLGCRKGKPKEEDEKETTEDQPSEEAEQQAILDNEILNHNLEREFESSRRFTHFNRGCGLGYPTTMYQPH